jgi:hypothetical protein
MTKKLHCLADRSAKELRCIPILETMIYVVSIRIGINYGGHFAQIDRNCMVLR